jgi:DNA-binding CsgD family transcriptional regulator
VAVGARSIGIPPQQFSWPLVGREDELAWLAAARREDAFPAVVVSGAAGVGKTRLAREALAAAASEGAATEWVQATQAAASIPLGAFAALVPVDVDKHDRLGVLQACAETLRARTGVQRPVLGVDDAHLLDPTSAALVLHLATTGTAFVVVTVRAGKHCPDSIVALWKDLEAPRLELQHLSADETAELVEKALGGELATSVKRWAYGASEGHVLYLRELVRGALANGALTNEDGLWELRSDPGANPALVDLISQSLEGLATEELDVARLVALGEPLELEIVLSLTDLGPLSALEEKGLVQFFLPSTPDERTEVRLAHPLYGEVLRGVTPSLRATEVRLRLADAVRGRGLERPGDALRVATWLGDAGAEIDETVLLAAAHDALTVGEPALAETLALRAGAGADAALTLATARALQGRCDEAEAVLAAWEDVLPSRELAVAYLEERALRVLHLGLKRPDEALRLLHRADGWFADGAWHDRVELIRTQVLLTGQGTGPAQAIEDLEQLLAHDDLIPEVRRTASIAYALSLFHVGRTQEMRELTAGLRPSLPLRDDDDVYALLAWWVVRQTPGYEWDDTERWLSDADRATARGGDPRTRGAIVTQLAFHAMRRGKPVTAARRVSEATEILQQFDPVRRLPLAWLVLVTSTAMRGDADGARKALAGYEAATGDAPVPYLHALETVARAELAALEGETSRAVTMLLDAVPANEGDPLDQATLLHEALRAGADPRTVAPALQSVAAACDAPLVALFADLASALAADDAEALLANADALADIGAMLWAAESAGLAAVAYARAGREDSARRATASSRRWLAECEEVWSPVLAALDLAPAELTRREREIVALVASGAPNADIAARLVLSVRTVESHLYRAMRKLGVDTRDQLRTQ